MTPKNEAEALMNDLLPFAKQMLQEFGEFHPFGGMMMADGSVKHTGAVTESEYGPPAELIVLLEGALREEAARRTIRVAALVLNVSVPAPGSDRKVDAIEVRLDHMEGFTASVFVPYAMSGGGLETGAPFASTGDRFAFGRR